MVLLLTTSVGKGNVITSYELAQCYLAKSRASLPSPAKADSLHDIPCYYLQVFGMPSWVYGFLGK